VLVIADALLSRIKGHISVAKITHLTTLAIWPLIITDLCAALRGIILILRNCSWTLIVLLFHIHFKVSLIIHYRCLTASAYMKNLKKLWGINSVLRGAICTPVPEFVLLLPLTLVRAELFELLHRTLSNYQNLNRWSVQKDHNFLGKNF